jgi:diguanylate cyclase (GGDEF)-like protein
MAQASALHMALMATQFKMKNGLQLTVSASIGVSFTPQDGTTVHGVIGAADKRMYDVKTNGRGHVRAE